jgi:hypothetical protein
MDYGLYKGILDESQKSSEVLALNVPRELVRKVAEVGVDELSPRRRSCPTWICPT